MKVNLKLIGDMKIEGKDDENNITYFDSKKELGGTESAATPMSVLLQAMTACSIMDVSAIIRKKRKTIESLDVEVEGIRADQHPKVFTFVKLIYKLKSPDATLEDLIRAVELSQTKYCGASALFKAAGCEVIAESVLV